MKIVNIKDSIHLGKPLAGEFPFISERPTPGKEREMMVRLTRDGRDINVSVNKSDYNIIEVLDPVGDDKMSPAMKVLDNTIRRQFEVMRTLTEFAIKGHVRSLIISGAAGIGKSYELERRLNTATEKNQIDMFTIVKGKISAIALFKTLFEHREEGSILVLDDIDSIFQDETSLNLLKGALDTGDVRRLSWLTAGAWLQENGVDSEFEFNGSVVFITNMDFDRMIEKGTNLAVHFKALISRSTYLDLRIHTNEEILVRIKQVVKDTTMLDVHGIDNSEKDAMMSWLEDNYTNLREISLRTILKLAAFMKGDPAGWQDIAEATMLRTMANYSTPSPLQQMVSSGQVPPSDMF